MRAQETVVSRAGNEKYREEYNRIFEKTMPEEKGGYVMPLSDLKDIENELQKN